MRTKEKCKQHLAGAAFWQALNACQVSCDSQTNLCKQKIKKTVQCEQTHTCINIINDNDGGCCYNENRGGDKGVVEFNTIMLLIWTRQIKVLQPSLHHTQITDELGSV